MQARRVDYGIHAAGLRDRGEGLEKGIDRGPRDPRPARHRAHTEGAVDGDVVPVQPGPHLGPLEAGEIGVAGERLVELVEVDARAVSGEVIEPQDEDGLGVCGGSGGGPLAALFRDLIRGLGRGPDRGLPGPPGGDRPPADEQPHQGRQGAHDPGEDVHPEEQQRGPHEDAEGPAPARQVVTPAARTPCCGAGAQAAGVDAGADSESAGGAGEAGHRMPAPCTAATTPSPAALSAPGSQARAPATPAVRQRVLPT